MKRILLISVLFICSAVRSEARIDPLQEDDIDYGCGCKFYAADAASDGYGLFLMWGLSGPARMRIDGQLETFSVSAPKTFRRPGSLERVGDRRIYTLESSKWSVNVDCRATEVCSPKDDDCEAQGYAGKLLLSSATARKMVRIQGVCGC